MPAAADIELLVKHALNRQQLNPLLRLLRRRLQDGSQLFTLLRSLLRSQRALRSLQFCHLIEGNYLNAGLLDLLLCLHEALATPPFKDQAQAAGAEHPSASPALKWDYFHGLLEEALSLLSAALQKKRQSRINNVSSDTHKQPKKQCETAAGGNLAPVAHADAAAAAADGKRPWPPRLQPQGFSQASVRNLSDSHAAAKESDEDATAAAGGGGILVTPQDCGSKDTAADTKDMALVLTAASAGETRLVRQRKAEGGPRLLQLADERDVSLEEVDESDLRELIELAALQQQCCSSVPSCCGNWSLLLQQQEQRVRLCVLLLLQQQQQLAARVLQLCGLNALELGALGGMRLLHSLGPKLENIPRLAGQGMQSKEKLLDLDSLVCLIRSPVAVMDTRLFLAALPLQQQQGQQHGLQQVGASSFSVAQEPSFSHQQVKLCVDMATELNDKSMLERCRDAARHLGDLPLLDYINAKYLLLQRTNCSTTTAKGKK
ncbi:hypothetical protein cyc_00656 [Cyclospora cayetanensis]|uniref:Uncharacterized protein n=1 Tax=Cyclospora cayetanensis TaxID=88456 RepID=A0A1D3D2A0_9EIME|nr:hypothetical protein cyc_00656 [Cyclospora cayetanensis]